MLCDAWQKTMAVKESYKWRTTVTHQRPDATTGKKKSEMCHSFQPDQSIIPVVALCRR
jgi:hypothetical protein